MVFLITESQYKLLVEQTQPYTDKQKYENALKMYNSVWGVYYEMVDYFNKIKSFKWEDKYKFNKFPQPNIYVDKTKLNLSISELKKYVTNDVELKKTMSSLKGQKYYVTYCRGKNGKWETKINLQKNPNENMDQQSKIFCPNTTDRHILLISEPKKPTLEKPIYQPTTNQQTSQKITPNKTNIDITKPVDFYFGTAIFRAPTFEIAQKFAEKLFIHNFNSNMVHVPSDKRNERWFVGHNDKIYVSEKKYNEDPNKNWWVDPIQMGLITLN